MWVVGAILAVALCWWATERVWDFAVRERVLVDNWYNGCLKVFLKVILVGVALLVWTVLWGVLF